MPRTSKRKRTGSGGTGIEAYGFWGSGVTYSGKWALVSGWAGIENGVRTRNFALGNKSVFAVESSISRCVVLK